MRLLKSGIKISDTGKELIIGDIVFFIVGEIVILLCASRKIYVSLGFLLGVLISVFMTFSMAIAIEQAMCLNESGADKHVKKTTLFRMLAAYVMLILVGIFDLGNIVAAVAGIMALKVSAYLQPFTHKVLAGKSMEKGR